MSTSVTFNGVSYTVPAIADASWGTNVSNYLIAIATGCLQKTGGTFTLTAEANFGATYGLKVAYLKTQTANIAAAGFLRLAKTDTVSWRNNANGADLVLGINASDLATFAGIALVDISTAQSLSNKTLVTPIIGDATGTSLSLTGTAGNGYIDLAEQSLNPTNPASSTLRLFADTSDVLWVLNHANVAAKVPLSGSIAVADLASGFLLPATKGGTGVANNVASTLAISGNFATTMTVTGVTGVTLPTSGTLATLAGAEAFTAKDYQGGTASNTSRLTVPKAAYATLTALTRKQGTLLYDTTGNRLLADDGSNLIPVNPATTKGDLPTFDTANARLPVGSDGQVLTSDSGQTTGLKWAAGASTTVAQFNVDIGNSSNVRTATNTNLLGDIAATTNSQTATMTIAAPGVVTSNSHGLALGDKFYFTTSGALPTGVSASTTYYASSIATNTFNISTTLANAIAGTYVTTSGSQSGTHTLFTGGLTLSPGIKRFSTSTTGIAVEVARASPVSTDPQNVYSGTYTPSFTTGTNVTGASGSAMTWMRVGNAVTVSGGVTVTTTAGSATSSDFQMTLPVASTLASLVQLAGAGSYQALNSESYMIFGDSSTHRAAFTFKSNNTAARNMAFTFTYVVI